MKRIDINWLLYVIMVFPSVRALPKPVDDKVFMDRRLHVDTLPAPSSETEGEALTQVEGSCQGNLTIPVEMTIANMTTCLRTLLNYTDLMGGIRNAARNGDLDIVFRNICVKWPQMKGCMKTGLESVEQCWGNRTREQLTRGMDTVVQFLCGNDNDGFRGHVLAPNA